MSGCPPRPDAVAGERVAYRFASLIADLDAGRMEIAGGPARRARVCDLRAGGRATATRLSP
jgi:hypothetical protein